LSFLCVDLFDFVELEMNHNHYPHQNKYINSKSANKHNLCYFSEFRMNIVLEMFLVVSLNFQH
jgi:hypothetical protein